MVARRKWLGYLLAISFVAVQNPTDMPPNAHAEGAGASLAWSIETSKKTFYPGEPVLFDLVVKNTGKQEERILFDGGGFGSFSVEIHNSSNKIVAKSGETPRDGLWNRVVHLRIAPGEIGREPIVLNGWCSTLLPPGRYGVVCRVEHLLRSEATRIPGTEKGLKPGPVHPIELSFDMDITEMNRSEFGKILAALAISQPKKKGQSVRERSRYGRAAQEMLALAESELAVPYQLEVVSTRGGTWLKWAAIASLVQSATLEAAIGLVQIVEDPSVYKEDTRRRIIRAVYQLRDTAKPEIIKATNEFVQKYKRPVPTMRIDHMQ